MVPPQLGWRSMAPHLHLAEPTDLLADGLAALCRCTVRWQNTWATSTSTMRLSCAGAAVVRWRAGSSIEIRRLRKNRGQHGRQRRFLTDIPTQIPTKPHRAARGVRRLPPRNVLPGSCRASHRRRGNAARGLGDGAGGAADLRRCVGRPWCVVRARLDSGRGQRNAVRSCLGDIRDTGRGGGHRGGCESHRPAGWPRQRAGSAGDETRRQHRRADRTARTLGGCRSAIHPRHIGCARLLCVWGIRSSIVADGDWFIYRFGAAGFCLHRTGRLYQESVVAVGILGDSGVVRERRRGRFRRAAWIPKMARARPPWQGQRHAGSGSGSRDVLTKCLPHSAFSAVRLQPAGVSISFHPSSPMLLEFATEYFTPSGPTTMPLCTS
jgi:hypothetical protein